MPAGAIRERSQLFSWSLHYINCFFLLNMYEYIGCNLNKQMNNGFADIFI